MRHMPATMGNPRINLLRAMLGVRNTCLPDDVERTALATLVIAIMLPRIAQSILEKGRTFQYALEF